MRKRPVTLKQVAEETGCSVAVASIVLNNAKGNIGVSDKMRREVQRVADKLGYQSNFAASALKRQCSSTLGLYVVPRPGGGLGAASFEDRLLLGIEKACLEHAYDLLVINISLQREPDTCLRLLRQKRVDGIVVIDPYRTPTETLGLLDAPGRVVSLGPGLGQHGVPAYAFDNAEAIRLAVRHLAELGHRRIGFVGHRAADLLADSSERAAAFPDVLAELGLPHVPEWTTLTDQDNGQLAGLLARPVQERPTALVAFNDTTAAMTSKRLYGLGFDLPTDMSISGVDDSALCRFLNPGLTTIRQPLEQMAYEAVTTLIGQIAPTAAGKGPSPSQSESQPIRRYPPKLVVRGSTAPPPP